MPDPGRTKTERLLCAFNNSFAAGKWASALDTADLLLDIFPGHAELLAHIFRIHCLSGGSEEARLFFARLEYLKYRIRDSVIAAAMESFGFLNEALACGASDASAMRMREVVCMSGVYMPLYDRILDFSGCGLLVSNLGQSNIIGHERYFLNLMLSRYGAERFGSVITLDPSPVGDYKGIEVVFIREVGDNMPDAVALPFFDTHAFFHFFNASPLRHLPFISPYLLETDCLMREIILDLAEEKKYVRALELGGIRDVRGESHSTRIIAESIGSRGELIAVDISPDSIERTRYYCAHTGCNIRYVQGDCLALLAGGYFAPDCVFDLYFQHITTDEAAEGIGHILLGSLCAAQKHLDIGSRVIFLRSTGNQPGPQERYLLESNAYEIRYLKSERQISDFVVATKIR